MEPAKDFLQVKSFNPHNDHKKEVLRSIEAKLLTQVTQLGSIGDKIQIYTPVAVFCSKMSV